MSDRSAIEWTDASWNPVRGSVKISPGCKHCCAETFAERFRGVPGHPYERGFDPMLVAARRADPLNGARQRSQQTVAREHLFRYHPDAMSQPPQPLLIAGLVPRTHATRQGRWAPLA